MLDAAGEALSVRQALALINEVLDETLAEQEGDFDADSRLALAWFEQYGFEEGPFGVAETLSKAKNSSVAGLEEAKVWKAGKGKVLSATARTPGCEVGTPAAISVSRSGRWCITFCAP